LAVWEDYRAIRGLPVYFGKDKFDASSEIYKRQVGGVLLHGLFFV
jgi:hypothetical protein